MGLAIEALKKGMQIDHKQEGFLIRVLWVIAVSGHIAWVCGFLAGIGLQSPFVHAGDMRKVEEKVDRSIELQIKQLKQSKATEIRVVLVKLCGPMTREERDQQLSEKDRLQTEYKELNGDFEYKEPPCEQLR